MLSWELDPALSLNPRFPVQAPAEELAYVFCANPAGGDEPETICVVDVNPTSRTYSEVVSEIALRQREEQPSALGRERNTGHIAGRAASVFGMHAGEKIAPRIRMAHAPEHRYGFHSRGFSLYDLSSAVAIWYRDGAPGESAPWASRKVIEIPAEPKSAAQLPALLRPSGVVPPLITDFALSLDDCFLYVACWGTGQLKQFDVSDPLLPREIASVCIGGIATRARHPSQVRAPGGGPCAVTLSRDGRRVYLTNSLSPVWDEQLYPDGLRGWMVKLDADPGGGITFDPNFFVDFGDLRPLQVRLPDQGLGIR